MADLQRCTQVGTNPPCCGDIYHFDLSYWAFQNVRTPNPKSAALALNMRFTLELRAGMAAACSSVTWWVLTVASHCLRQRLCPGAPLCLCLPSCEQWFRVG